METCPHCFNIVLPRDDNTCPACQNSFYDYHDSNPLLTTFVITERMILPDICCICNTTTNSKMKFTDKCDPAIWRVGDPSFNYSNECERTKIPLSPIVEINIPLCKNCEKQYSNIHKHTEFENSEMTFIVSKIFRDKVILLNENQ
jgi:hypothetical protein